MIGRLLTDAVETRRSALHVILQQRTSPRSYVMEKEGAVFCRYCFADRLRNNVMDLTRLASQFGGQVLHASLIQTGINKTYRIDGCGIAPRYLRLYRKTGRSLEEINFELYLLQHLSDLDLVTVAKPIPDVYGNLILEILDEGEPRIACMFDAAEGRAPGSSVDDMRRLGQALATLHNATRRVCVPYSRPINVSSVIRELIIALQQLGSTCIAIAENIEKEFEYLPAELTHPDLPLGPCHGDVWAGNVRVLDGEVTFFDFDECGVGPYVIDLATPAWHLAILNETDAPTLWRAFFKGYESQRQLNEAERAALPASIVLQHFRSVLSLARFCILPEALWVETAERTMAIIEAYKGTNARLAFLYES